MTDLAREEATVMDVAAEMIFRSLRTEMPRSAGTPGVSFARLLAYAERDANAPADFALEQALRRDASVALRFRRILEGRAIAMSHMAMAAASGLYPERRVGGYHLRVVDEGDALYVVLTSPKTDTQLPIALELLGEADRERLPLPTHVRGHITVPLDRTLPSYARLKALLRDPHTILFLL